MSSAIIHLSNVTVGRDGESRYTPNGTMVLDFSVAHNFGKKKQDGEWENFANWYRVKVFGAQAERATNNGILKGDRLNIVGELQVEEWEKDGQKRYGLVVIAMKVESLKKKQSESNGESNTVETESEEPPLPF